MIFCVRILNIFFVKKSGFHDNVRYSGKKRKMGEDRFSSNGLTFKQKCKTVRWRIITIEVNKIQNKRRSAAARCYVFVSLPKLSKDFPYFILLYSFNGNVLYLV